MDERAPGLIFEVFNSIGIIEQLTRTRLEAQLPDGLIAPHFGVLNHLVRLGDGSTPLQIARAFEVPKTSMTHTLKGLEARGLVDVVPNPKDGRSKIVKLTSAGRDLRNQTIINLSDGFGLLLEHMDSTDFETLAPLLYKLRRVLDENRDA